jgi:NADH-quinone oxidoreductase subunit M
MLWMFQRVFFEKSKEKTESFEDLNGLEIITFVPVILLIIVMGIFPQSFLSKIEPTAQQHIAQLTTVSSTQIVETTVQNPGLNNHKN